jgi:copper oxidase (laccase) domain-containing protein
VDLAGENRRRLIAAGVASESIDVLPLCTRCRADLFHSWRRDGAEAGRMVSFVKIINEVR